MYLDLTFYCQALSKEVHIYKVFGMPQPGIEPMISCTPGKHSTTRTRLQLLYRKIVDRGLVFFVTCLEV